MLYFFINFKKIISKIKLYIIVKDKDYKILFNTGCYSYICYYCRSDSKQTIIRIKIIRRDNERS